MREKISTLLQEEPMFSGTSEHQKKFLTESTYCHVTPGGKSYERTFELLAYNMISGKILLKEKVSFDADKYEKVYVLSKEGKTEKFRGAGF